MASVVDICNLAVSRLGDDATISSIDPPEGSTQAEYCARFWPIARDTLLQSHPWSFATARATLAALTPETEAWAYAYAMPSNCLRVLSVQHYEAPDYGLNESTEYGIAMPSAYSPQPFAAEVFADGMAVILTNQEEAAARYIRRVTDPSRYSPMFIEAASWLLASYLAGPMIKGTEGEKMAQYCTGMMEAMKARAIVADTAQRAGRPAHRVSWMASR